MPASSLFTRQLLVSICLPLDGIGLSCFRIPQLYGIGKHAAGSDKFKLSEYRFTMPYLLSTRVGDLVII